ncbi:MAG: hypothetical protein AAFQ87_25340 [Bacteroidota bacterium]
MKNRIFLTLMTMILLVITVQAQPPVRPEDHFWRKRVVNRISLVEKINRPMVYHESGFYQGNPAFSEHDGIVVSLIDGLKAGRYVAYDGDEWEKVLSYEDVVQRIREHEQSLEMPVEDDWGDDISSSSDWENPAEEESEWGSDSEWDTGGDWEISSSEDDWATPFDEDAKASEDPFVVVEDVNQELDLAPYEEVIHMVEDWIFDRNTSSMVYQLDFFEVIWTDPSGMLPEKVLARFKWKEVKEQLMATQWKNRFNDAKALSVAEAFELRIFRSILINVGGEPVRTLQEAKRRRDEMVEFEHHLWSY